MTRTHALGSLACLLLVAASLTACDDDESQPTGGSGGGTGGTPAIGGQAEGGAGGAGGSASQGGAGGSCDPGEGGSGPTLDEVDPCNGFGDLRVAWVTEGDPEILIQQDVELLWGFQFAVAIPAADFADVALENIICQQPAGSDEECTTIPIELESGECAVMFAPKFGVDPSQYAVGDNRYRFTMQLVRGCDVVSQDSFEIVLTYDPA